MEKIKYVPRIMWVQDPIYKQHFYFIECKREDFKRVMAEQLNTTENKITVDLDGCDGMRAVLEDIDQKYKVPFIWVKDDCTASTLDHELLHQCFAVFENILCGGYIKSENEEPFCYYFEYIRDILKSEFTKKYGKKTIKKSANKSIKKTTKKTTKKFTNKSDNKTVNKISKRTLKKVIIK